MNYKRTGIKYLFLKSKTIIGLLIIALATKCDLDGTLDSYNPNKGFIEAEVNGDYWRVDCAVPNAKNDFDEILMLGMYFNESTRLWESINLSFFSVPKKDTVIFRGNFIDCDPKLTVKFHSLYEEQDVAYESFSLLNNSSNYLEVFVKGNYREMEGHFDFTLVKIPSSAKNESPMPDTLRFTNGYFFNDLR